MEDGMTKPEYVYVASSWRNILHDGIIQMLKAADIPHYDFKEPTSAFAWEQVMPNYIPGSEDIAIGDYLAGMAHPLAQAGLAQDKAALDKADTLVLVLPCGKSAHLELGYAIGQGKRTCIFIPSKPDSIQPELMYGMADHMTTSVMELLAWLGVEDS